MQAQSINSLPNDANPFGLKVSCVMGEKHALIKNCLLVIDDVGGEHIVTKSSYLRVVSDPKLSLTPMLSEFDIVETTAPIEDRMVNYLQEYSLDTLQGNDYETAIKKIRQCMVEIRDNYLIHLERNGTNLSEGKMMFKKVLPRLMTSIPMGLRRVIRL